MPLETSYGRRFFRVAARVERAAPEGRLGSEGSRRRSRRVLRGKGVRPLPTIALAGAGYQPFQCAGHVGTFGKDWQQRVRRIAAKAWRDGGERVARHLERGEDLPPLQR